MEEAPSTARIALKWGIIAGVITSLVSLGYQLSGLAPDDPTQANSTSIISNILSIAFTIFVITRALKEFKTANGGYIKVGEGVGIGALCGAVWGIVSGGFSTFYRLVIDDSQVQKMLESVEEAYLNRGMSEEQVDSAMGIVRMMSSPGTAFVITFFTGIIVGAIVSLVVAAIIQNKKPVFD